MESAGYGSASGAVDELKRIGAVEGTHYRMSREGEMLTDFILAIDTGPMVITMLGGFDTVAMPNLGAFAVLNADGMEYVGAAISARQMREGKIPAEAAYVLGVEED